MIDKVKRGKIVESYLQQKKIYIDSKLFIEHLDYERFIMWSNVVFTNIVSSNSLKNYKLNDYVPTRRGYKKRREM